MVGACLRTARYSAAVLLALLAAALAAPRADAQCGHYVVQGTPAIHHEEPPVPDPTPPPKPCQGPHCSRGTPQPLVPASPVPPPADEWGQLAASGACAKADASDYPAGRHAAIPVRVAVSIFHPPRCP